MPTLKTKVVRTEDRPDGRVLILDETNGPMPNMIIRGDVAPKEGDEIEITEQGATIKTGGRVLTMKRKGHLLV